MAARRMTKEELEFIKSRRKDRQEEREPHKKVEEAEVVYPPVGGPKNRGEVDLKDGRVLYACSACESGQHDTCEKMQLRFCYCFRWKHKPKKNEDECKNAAGYWIKLKAEGKASFIKEPAWAAKLREARWALQPKKLIEEPEDDDDEWEDMDASEEFDDDDDFEEHQAEDDEEWEDE